MTYCIWVASEHILFDDTVLKSHPDFSKKYTPIISNDNYEDSLARFTELMSDMTIKEVVLSKESIDIILVDSHKKIHSISSFKYSEKFPEQVGTGKKRNSFETGEMKDYWLVTYDGTHLKV